MKKTSIWIGLCAAWAMAATVATAQIPQMLHYQGKISATQGLTPFTGLGHFRFALVDATGANTYWSNDGTIGAGAFPSAHVPIPVNNGIYSVMLGSTIAGMTTQIDPSVFANSFVSLRVWFSSDAGATFSQLTPDMRIASVGYAMIAESVVNGAIDQSKLADGAVIGPKLPDGVVTTPKLADAAVTAHKLAQDAVTTSKLAESAVTAPKLARDAVTSGAIQDGAVTTAKVAAGAISGLEIKDNSVTGSDLANDLYLGSPTAIGRLHLWDPDYPDHPRVIVDGPNEVRINKSDGDPGVLINPDDAGLLNIYDQDGAPVISLDGGSGGSVTASADGSGHGGFSVKVENALKAWLTANSEGGELVLFQNSERSGIAMAGSLFEGGGAIFVNKADGSTGVDIWGDIEGAGLLSVRGTGATSAITLDGRGNDGGGDIIVKNDRGTETVVINGTAEGGGQGSQILLYNESHINTVEIDGDDKSGSGGWIGLWPANRGENDSPRIELDANATGGARITTDVLEIKGGSDLSENFDITSVDDAAKPGAVVCIDPNNPGQLVLSTKAYDRTVAGILSGAGGVKPGMLMGQTGTAASGKHPVALTGRVYCYVDASNEVIQPGDLLTTSDVPGHAMKATDHDLAQGAIIGKAMTPLAKGRGLVLVLVSLQ